MKTDKVLFIRFEHWNEFKTRMMSDLENRRVSKSRRDTLVFNSVVDYQKFMTEQKLAILAAIIHKAPSSIYQLSKVVERDFANVQRDCVALESMGFIELEDSGDTKRSKRPKLPFHYVRIVVCMPSLSYAHDFQEAA